VLDLYTSADFELDSVVGSGFMIQRLI